jgi:hypothetical protein
MDREKEVLITNLHKLFLHYQIRKADRIKHKLEMTSFEQEVKKIVNDLLEYADGFEKLLK